MRFFVQYLTCLVTLTAATYFFVPRFYGVDYPKLPGPQLDPSSRTIYQRKIDRLQPDIILIGDSMAATNIDLVALSAGVNKKVYTISVSGSASSLWYLIIKNDVVTAKHKPAYLIVLFRDTMLTTPDYRVQGSYFQQIDEFAGADDKLLIQLAFVNKMNPIEKFADQYLPIYGSRMDLRATVHGALRDISPRLLMTCDAGCVNDSLSSVFRSDEFLPNVMGGALNSADQYLYTGENLNFPRQVMQSFLPEIIRLCNENDIQLILVRSTTFVFSPRSPAPPALEIYMNQLASYAAKNDVLFLDLSNNPRFTPDLYFDSIHLNAKGQAVFTNVLLESLTPLVH